MPDYLRSLFASAGLWEFWTDGVEKLATRCIITTDANELVGTIHNRMPVVLLPAAYAPWLSPETGIAEVKGMLRPYPADEVEAVAMGPAVNSPRNEGPDVLNSA